MNRKKLNELEALYKALILDPAKRDYKKGADYLGIPGARMISGNEWADPHAWYNGYSFSCVDIECSLLDMIEEERGQEERDRAAMHNDIFMKYAEEKRESLISDIEEMGIPCTWLDFWKSMRLEREAIHDPALYTD